MPYAVPGPGSMVMLMWLSLFPSWLLLGVVEAELEPPPLLDPPEPPPPQLPPPEKKPLMPDCNHTPESPWLLKFSCVAAAENVWSEQTQNNNRQENAEPGMTAFTSLSDGSPLSSLP